MTKAQILELLYSVHKRPSTIAHSLDVSRSVVSQALNGKGSQRVRLKIAKTINKPPSMIWVNAPRSQSVLDDDIFYHMELYPTFSDIVKEF